MRCALFVPLLLALACLLPRPLPIAPPDDPRIASSVPQDHMLAGPGALACHAPDEALNPAPLLSAAPEAWPRPASTRFELPRGERLLGFSRRPLRPPNAARLCLLRANRYQERAGEIATRLDHRLLRTRTV